MNNRRFCAFLITLVIYLLFSILLLLIKTPQEKTVQEDRKVMNLSQFETPKEEAQSKPTQTQQSKPQKQAKQKPTPTPKHIAKQLSKEPMPHTKIEQNITSPTPPQAKTSKMSSTLSALNDVFKSTRPTEAKGPIKELYGDEYERMTKEQKEFIKDNLSSIGRITQKYLQYPEAAGRLSMQGRSVVEFLLHPNGDITNLRLLDSSGYRALDNNSIETIQIAYKDYPRPSQTTMIRIYVHYELY